MKITSINTAVFLLFLFGLVNIGRADTYISGPIPSGTWLLAGSPYVITGSGSISGGNTLIISPGVIVKFDPGTSLLIDGKLVARGTSENKITFTSNLLNPSSGDWAYILFRDSSVDASFDVEGNYVDGSILEYCIIEYGGGANVEYDGTVRMNSSHTFINQCVIQNNSASGISVVGASSTLKIQNNLLENNNASLSATTPQGGGLYLNSMDGSVITVYNNRIRNNIGDQKGGGIYYDGVGTVYIMKNIIENNIARLGGGIYYTGSRVTDEKIIEKNLFLKNDARLLNPTSTGWGGGIRAQGGSPTVRYNIFSGNKAPGGNSAGISQNSIPSISYNLFHQNTALTTAVTETHRTTSFIGNTVTENNATGTEMTRAITVGTWLVSLPTINNNNIFNNNTTYALWDDNAEGSDDINVESNWWGGATEQEVLAAIYDFYDDSDKSVADYTPWLSDLNSQAPISPPQGLSVTSKDLNSISLEWNPNPESDLSGYRLYWSTTPGFFYSNQSDLGDVNSHTLNNLSTGTYYIAVTAFDSNYSSVSDDITTLINEKQTAGNESWYAEIIVEIKDSFSWTTFLPAIINRAEP